MKKIIKKRST